MKKPPSIAILLGAICLSVAACSATRSSATTAPSGALFQPQAQSSEAEPALIQRLRQARAFDRSQSTAFTRSAPSLDHYYSRKANEITDVMSRLRAGKEVPQDDINHALDNSLASTFGVPVQ